jgi:NAD(P)-dependent dehydrogenase (short-subunit alcohol dehydrogenase family)
MAATGMARRTEPQPTAEPPRASAEHREGPPIFGSAGLLVSNGPGSHRRSVAPAATPPAQRALTGRLSAGGYGLAGQGRTGAARVAVVTGGSAGIGLATAQLFAQRGWSVAILARGAERLAEAEALLAREGGRVLAIPADVADAAAVEAAADRIEQELGPIRAWINNAMTTIVSPADQVTPEEYRTVTGATYLGTVHGTLSALHRMKPRDRGVIVQVSSGLAIRAAPLQAPYCAAKFAISGFTDSLRAELIHENSKIALSVVYLPAVNTPQFGWTRTRTGHGQRAPDPVFDPRLCAEAIHHAAERPTREVWVGRTSVLMGSGPGPPAVLRRPQGGAELGRHGGGQGGPGSARQPRRTGAGRGAHRRCHERAGQDDPLRVLDQPGARCPRARCRRRRPARNRPGGARSAPAAASARAALSESAFRRSGHRFVERMHVKTKS